MKTDSLEFYQRNGFISLLVNSIPNIKELSYLELGLHRGENFNAVNARNKDSVDCDISTSATYHMTTDRFFELNSIKYDVIFIDANHEYEQILKDFQNALRVCNKYIFLHDMFPAKEEYTSLAKCGDAFKLLYYLIKQQHLNNYIRTLNADCGLTAVKLPLEITYLSPPLADVKSLTYADFRLWAKDYHRYCFAEMRDFIS